MEWYWIASISVVAVILIRIIAVKIRNRGSYSYSPSYSGGLDSKLSRIRGTFSKVCDEIKNMVGC